MNETAAGDDRRIDEAMRSRAERGRPRGPERVWADAATSRGSQARVALSRRWVIAGVAAILVLGVSVAVWPRGQEVNYASDPPNQPGGAHQMSVPPAPSVTAASETPESSFPKSSEARVEAYLACVTEHGFPLDYAEIVGGRRPDWVKTLVDVPAVIHRPCLQAIGGRDPLSSSLGHRTSLGRCESTDDEPPIDWQPAPALSFPNSIISPASRTLTQGSSSLVLAWSQAEAETLEVPNQVTVECWNGRDWQPAYNVVDFGGSNPSYRELEEDPPKGGASAQVTAPTFSLPIPQVAPVTSYRLVDEARHCSSAGSCEDVRLEVALKLESAR